MDLGLTEEEEFLTLEQLEADLHRNTGLTWLLRYLATQDETIKEALLAADPEEQTKSIRQWHGMRFLIQSVFDAIQEIRNEHQGNE
jgi:hypothetical protein